LNIPFKDSSNKAESELINELSLKDSESFAKEIYTIKNNSLIKGYNRLDLEPDKNINYYINQEEGRFIICECSD
jgi:hypothetical protein